jgi:hypothetical protein
MYFASSFENTKNSIANAYIHRIAYEISTHK